MSNVPELSEVLKLSHFRYSPEDYKDLVESFMNFRDKQKQRILDEHATHILACTDWRVKLSEKLRDMAHYNEFVAFIKGGCKNGQRNKDCRCNCRECAQRQTYERDKGKPSGLLRLIRNILAHPKQMMERFPNGVVSRVLSPHGYDDLHSFVVYWLDKFPKLFHFVAALNNDQVNLFDWSEDCVAEKAIILLQSALEEEKNRGKILKTYMCKLPDGRQFKLELLEMLKLNPENPNRRKIDCVNQLLVKVEHSSLTVKLRSCKSLKYPLAPLQPGNSNSETFNLITGINMFNNENCKNTSRVVLLVETSELMDEVDRRLRTFTCFTHEANLETYLNRWLVERKVHVDEFRPLPDIVYVILHPDCFPSVLDVGKEHVLLSDLIWYSSSTVKAQLLNKETDLDAVKALDSNVVVFTDRFTTYDYINNRFTKLCKDQKLQIIQVQIDVESKLSQLIFLTPDRDLTGHVGEKLVFATADAGEGKSTLFEHLFFRSCSPKVGEQLLHTTARKLLGSRQDSVVETIKASVYPLEFKSSESVTLLIDAIDEVEIECIHDLKKILKDLTGCPNLRIIANMRSYIESKIVSEFENPKIFKLAGLTCNDKQSVILNYWKHKSTSAESISKKLNDCHERAAVLIVRNHKPDFELSPLHCRLLADIYWDHIKQSFNMFVEFLNQISVLEIYETTISKNFDRYLSEKQKIDKNQSQVVCARLEEEYGFAHVHLALKQLCPQHVDLFQDALKHPNIKLTPGQGLLHNLNPVDFNHPTIPEYFVDRFSFQVLCGQIKLHKKDLRDFSQFFMAPYIENPQVFFLNKMLEKEETQICFRFDLDEVNIRKLITTIVYSPTYLTMFTVRSLAVKSRELFKKPHNEFDAQVLRDLFYSCLRNDHYELAYLLIEVPLSNGILGNKSYSGFIYMLSLVLSRGPLKLTNVNVDQKKKMIDWLVTTFLPCEDYSIFVRYPHEVPEKVSFEQFLYSIQRIKERMEQSDQNGEQVLQDILLQTDIFRNNLLRENSREFLHRFLEEFPKEFYRLANSINRRGETFLHRSDFREIPEEVDYCIKHFNGDLQEVSACTIARQISVKSEQGRNLLHFLKTRDDWEEVSRLLRSTRLVGDRVSANIQTGEFDSLLGAFSACAREDEANSFRSGAANELSPFYNAEYIRNWLFHTRNDDIQDWLIGTVLATEGMKFKNPVCCHLLNDLIADIPDDNLVFQLSEKHVDAMCVNDSVFIVACKTGNVNIAKLLAKSFKAKWISCLDDFPLMCVFRALDQHCGDLLEEIVGKLADQNFSVPNLLAQESLITGNLKLCRLYVEQLGFTNVPENAHFILENSWFDLDLIIERKKVLIEYILRKFPDSFKGMKCICDDPRDWKVINNGTLLSTLSVDDKCTRLIHGVHLELLKCLIANDCDGNDNDKMDAHKYPNLIQSTKESLITGNLDVLKLNVEQLRVTDVEENAHLIFQDSWNDPLMVIDHKRDMIKYVQNKFPKSFIGIKCSSDDPPSRSGINASENDHNSNTMIYRVHLRLIKCLGELIAIDSSDV